MLIETGIPTLQPSQSCQILLAAPHLSEHFPIDFQRFVRTGTADLHPNQLLHTDPSDRLRPGHRHVRSLRHNVGERARFLPPGPKKRHAVPETSHRPGRGAKLTLEHVHPTNPRVPGGQPPEIGRGEGRGRGPRSERQPARVRGGSVQHQHRGESAERVQRASGDRA